MDEKTFLSVFLVVVVLLRSEGLISRRLWHLIKNNAFESVGELTPKSHMFV